MTCRQLRLNITATKRSTRPDIFRRKDARTQLYRTVFGEATTKSPHELRTRHTSQDWSWELARSTTLALWSTCRFDAQRAKQVLAQINSYCPRNATELTLAELQS